MSAAAPIGDSHIRGAGHANDDEDYPVADARSAVRVGVYASAARCLLQYVIAPTLGAFGFWLPWFGLTIQAVACLITIAAVTHLRRIGDRRWRVSAVIALSVVLSTVLATAGLVN